MRTSVCLSVYERLSRACESYVTTVMSEGGRVSRWEGRISTTATGETMMDSGTDEWQCCF